MSAPTILGMRADARAPPPAQRRPRADVTSTLTFDEAADQPAPAVRLATERRESDGRFARRWPGRHEIDRTRWWCRVVVTRPALARIQQCRLPSRSAAKRHPRQRPQQPDTAAQYRSRPGNTG